MPPQFKSSREVAELIGCSKPTVTRAAKKLGVGTRIGQTLAFSKGEIEQIRKAVRKGPGNPNFRRKDA